MSTGIITTFAGTGVQGYSGDGGPATSAKLEYPSGVAFDASGNLYIGDDLRIRKVDTSGVITTVTGTVGHYNCGIAVNASGELFFSDGATRVYKVDASGIITTVAGNGSYGYSGDGGPAIDAELYVPVGIVFDNANNLYIGDQANNRIRKVDTSGIITTFAGTGVQGYSGDGGPATSAELNNTDFLAIGPSGSLYITDQGNNRIRKVDASGVITTVAGTGVPGYSGDGGPATEAEFSGIFSLVLGSGGNLYIVDGYDVIRKVDASGVITTVAGTGVPGYSGDGGPATEAELNSPMFIAAYGNGFYISDMGNSVIRKVTTPIQCTATQVLIDARSGRPVNFANH